jgi:DNA-binding response OmpR family regulator
METTDMIKVLVVEDEPSLSSLCWKVLTQEGFYVDIAENGKVAQVMILHQQYDLCLIDIRTPKMSGEELYYWIREEYPALAEGLIFTTGDVLSEDAKRFLDETARPALIKPFLPTDLKKLVKESLKAAKIL